MASQAAKRLWARGLLSNVYKAQDVAAVNSGDFIMPPGWCLGSSKGKVLHRGRCGGSTVDHYEVYQYKDKADLEALMSTDKKRLCSKSPCVDAFNEEFGGADAAAGSSVATSAAIMQEASKLASKAAHTAMHTAAKKFGKIAASRLVKQALSGR